MNITWILAALLAFGVGAWIVERLRKRKPSEPNTLGGVANQAEIDRARDGTTDAQIRAEVFRHQGPPSP